VVGRKLHQGVAEFRHSFRAGEVLDRRFRALGVDHFGNPGGDRSRAPSSGGSGGFGQIRSTVDNPHIVQIAAKIIF